MPDPVVSDQDASAETATQTAAQTASQTDEYHFSLVRATAQHPHLTALVIFLGMLLFAGTVTVFGTIAYRLSEMAAENASSPDSETQQE